MTITGWRIRTCNVDNDRNIYSSADWSWELYNIKPKCPDRDIQTINIWCDNGEMQILAGADHYTKYGKNIITFGSGPAANVIGWNKRGTEVDTNWYNEIYDQAVRDVNNPGGAT